MRCPKCTSIEDKVIDSRISKEGSTIRRRRECLECGYRYSTTETLVRDGIVVIKRDGRREDFSREKLLTGLRRACSKRNISVAQLEFLVSDIEAKIAADGLKRNIPVQFTLAKDSEHGAWFATVENVVHGSKRIAPINLSTLDSPEYEELLKHHQGMLAIGQGPYTISIEGKADQIVVVSRFRFTRDETLETQLTAR